MSKKPSKVGREILVWDQSDVTEAEIERRLEEARGNGERIDESKIRNDVYSDSDYFSIEWDEFTDALSEIIKDKNPGGSWYAEVKNFGWDNRDGQKTFNAVDGQAFLRSILPQTDCTFHIFHYGRRGLAIQNYHHDSPVGNEWYYVVPDKGS